MIFTLFSATCEERDFISFADVSGDVLIQKRKKKVTRRIEAVKPQRATRSRRVIFA